MGVQNDQLTTIASGTKTGLVVETIGCRIARVGATPGTFLLTMVQPIEPTEIISSVNPSTAGAEGSLAFASPTTALLVITKDGVPFEADFGFKIERQASGSVDTVAASGPPIPPTVGGPGDVFVFRPGGVAAGNVYTNWALLMADCDLVAGPRTISFDDSIVSPCVIPAGVWNMFEVVWTAPSSGVNVSVTEGASFTQLRKIVGGVFITWGGLTPPVADLGQTATGIDIFEFNGEGTGAGATLLGGGIFATGPSTGPFFLMPGPGTIVEISLQNEVSVFKDLGSFQLISQPGGGDLIVSVGISCLFDSDLIISGGGGTTTIQYSASSVFSGLGESQPAVPVVGVFVATKLRMQPTPSIFANGTNAPAIADPSPQANDIVRCDPTAGTFAVTLPSIPVAGSGAFVTVKIVAISANSIIVTPQGGETIDGAANFVLSALTRASLTVVSDGISDWMVMIQ